MSLVQPFVRDGMQRDIVPGDVLNRFESVTTLANAASVTLSFAQLTAGILNRTGPAGAYGDTTPTASDIVNGILGQNAVQFPGATTPAGVQPGSTFWLKYINNIAAIATLVAGAGVTLAGTTAIAASSVRNYLVTILNGTPPQTFAANTTNASAVVTGLSQAQTQLLSPGMLVTGTGIPALAQIASIQPGVGITLSANATATGSLVSLAFTPRVEVRGVDQSLL